MTLSILDRVWIKTGLFKRH